ncbi:GNAT family N-acetyltransferase [Marinococcus halophilus]|uniref:GCN5 family N-acetyltransferase n=1 Tax=Marinococcus halophilus TaxID=1371 RepID=A0A510Y5A9_MARHA|nr:GNAT family N-acetyltransferase [Marinococcus halophilus]GEK58522.1 GCN5 family N-acetyltransferase [Marinococcus halophilus]
MYIKRTEDSALLSRLNQSLHEWHVNLHPELFFPYDQPSTQVYFENKLADDCHMFFIAVEDEEPLGYVWLELRKEKGNDFKRPSHYGYIYQIVVKEQHQGQGIGAFLMKEAEYVARDYGADRLELDYLAQNYIAEAFYKKIGYESKRVTVHKEL